MRYIERSDWDARIVRLEPWFDRFCMIAAVLSGLVLSLIIGAALLK